LNYVKSHIEIYLVSIIMNDENENDNNEALDTNWITHFETIDNSYNVFYLDDVHSIKIKYIYINKENEIEKMKQENRILESPNYLSRDAVMSMIKHNLHSNYGLLSILKYNINLDPRNVKAFVAATNYEESFLTHIKNIDEIHWDMTISMFQDLNELTFLFYEKNGSHANNATRKIWLQRHLKKVKKTIRVNPTIHNNK
jgi:hypothetical protein